MAIMNKPPIQPKTTWNGQPSIDQLPEGLNPKNQVRAWNQPVYIPKLEENND